MGNARDCPREFKKAGGNLPSPRSSAWRRSNLAARFIHQKKRFGESPGGRCQSDFGGGFYPLARLCLPAISSAECDCQSKYFQTTAVRARRPPPLRRVF